MVAQTWIIECLKIGNLSVKVINIITKAIENWQVELAVGERTLAEMKIQRKRLIWSHKLE